MAKIDELTWEPNHKENITFYYDLNNTNKRFDTCKLEIENLTIDPGEMELNWSVNYNKPSYTTISFQVNDNQTSITRFYNWARGRKFDFNIETTDPAGCVIKKTQVKNAVLVNADGENGKIDRFSFFADYFTVEFGDTVKTIENAFVVDYAETINKNIVNNLKEDKNCFTTGTWWYATQYNPLSALPVMALDDGSELTNKQTNEDNMETDYIYTSHIETATDNLRNNQTYVSSDPIEAIRKTFDTEQVSSEDMLI